MPRLERSYAFVETDPSKAADLARPLWRYLSVKMPLGVDIGPLKQKEMADLMRERFTNYLYARLVIGACHALIRSRTSSVPGKNDSGLPVEGEDSVLEMAVSSVLDVDDEAVSDIVAYLTPLCARILSNKNAKPSPSQTKAIRRHAVSQGHRCYLCGRELHYEKKRPYPAIPEGAADDDIARIKKIREKRAFEIEHIWSQSRGGSRHRVNLASSCNECNKIKAHLISFADLPVEQMITETTTGESLAAALDGRARLAILSRQDARCAHCGIKFHTLESEDLYAVKKEWDEPYHFYNLLLVCVECRTLHYASRERSDEHGINLRAPKG